MFTAVLLIEEEPSSAPAASPRLRRRHSPWPSRTRVSPARKVPCATEGDRDAPLPAHIHQIRAGIALRDVTTLVPRVLLSILLTGPTPSGSADAPRLCRGCSHPPRHLPDQAAPSSIRPLRRPDDVGLSPPLEQQRLTAHETSIERVRDHLRRPIPGRRNLLMETAGNTVSATDPMTAPMSPFALPKAGVRTLFSDSALIPVSSGHPSAVVTPRPV